MKQPKPRTPYDDVRNALARLVVRCAREANARRRSGPKAQGWRGAERALGIQFATLQSVAWGCARWTTAERVRAALIAAGEMATPAPSKEQEDCE